MGGDRAGGAGVKNMEFAGRAGELTRGRNRGDGLVEILAAGAETNDGGR